MGIHIKLAMLMALLPAMQGPLYIVDGNLATGSGLIEEPFLVQLENLGGQTIEEMYASAAGSFRFRNIQAGKYYVRVTHQEFKDVWLLIDVPTTSEGLTIFMSRKDTFGSRHPDMLGSKHKVDLRQLSIPKAAVREFQKALKDEQGGNTSSAIRRLHNATRFAPDFAEAYTELGRIYLDNDDLGQALTTLDHAAQIDGNSIEAGFYRASTLYKMNRFQEAEAVLLQVQNRHPKQPRSALCWRTFS